MSTSRRFPGDRRQGRTAKKSNFTQTCNLLSQYMKEKGSLRDLNLEIGGKVESVEAIAQTSVNSHNNSGKSARSRPERRSSMDHFHVKSDSSNKASTRKEATKKGPTNEQLTIFYSGRVLVFYDYPMEKVRDLVSVAKKSSSQMSYGILSNTYQKKAGTGTGIGRPLAHTLHDGLPPRPHVFENRQANNFQDRTSSRVNKTVESILRYEELPPQPEANGSDLPIARRSSIHSFLEKRKDRTAIRGPYQIQQIPGPPTKGDVHLDLNTLPSLQ